MKGGFPFSIELFENLKLFNYQKWKLGNDQDLYTFYQ